MKSLIAGDFDHLITVLVSMEAMGRRQNTTIVENCPAALVLPQSWRQLDAHEPWELSVINILDG